MSTTNTSSLQTFATLVVGSVLMFSVAKAVTTNTSICGNSLCGSKGSSSDDEEEAKVGAGAAKRLGGRR